MAELQIFISTEISRINQRAGCTFKYTYDANGNMMYYYCNNKIAVIKYNALNLSDKMQFTYGHTTDYLYDAAGSKLSVTNTTADTNLLVPMRNIEPVQVNHYPFS